ncbi:hypothetical protein MB14_09015 [Roseivirga ehrenbergii]|uniref:Uncharacterized protein n=1 Tax=Roseivirga ehrenbergii (strain DSM 102268 / JCM 13514 / KCTC 12282 / NCIMB 14502 / KMM 6017) TaxID=279360 RepID=A0A150X0A9_ROSEK|nr:hypothetical protein MB14_09015 [Roseivirga ehrenbergii]
MLWVKAKNSKNYFKVGIGVLVERDFFIISLCLNITCFLALLALKLSLMTVASGKGFIEGTMIL